MPASWAAARSAGIYGEMLLAIGERRTIDAARGDRPDGTGITTTAADSHHDRSVAEAREMGA